MISVNKRHKYLGSATGNFFMHIGHGVKVCFNHGGHGEHSGDAGSSPA